MGLSDVGIRAQRVWIPTTSCGHMCVCVAVSSFFIPFLHHVCAIGLHTHLSVHMHSHVSARANRHHLLPQDAVEARPSHILLVFVRLCVFTACSRHQALTQKGPSRAGALCTHRIISSKNFPTAVHGEESTAPRLRCLGCFYRGGTFRRQWNCASPSLMPCL